MVFLFEERVFETPVGQRAAMLITPASHLRVGKDRLSSDPPTGLSEVDAEILSQAELRASRVELAIFRGQDDDGRGSWAFADDLEDEDAVVVASRMLDSHLMVYRGLVKAGLCLHVHVEWGPRELRAFRIVTQEKIETLEDRIAERRTAEAASDAVDLWILRNLVFYFGVSLDKLLTTILPDKLPLMEKRIIRVQRMMEAMKP